MELMNADEVVTYFFLQVDPSERTSLRLRPRQQLKARPEVGTSVNLTPMSSKLVVDEVPASDPAPPAAASNSVPTSNPPNEQKNNVFNVKVNGSNGTGTLATLTGSPPGNDGKTTATVIQQNVNETHL